MDDPDDQCFTVVGAGEFSKRLEGVQSGDLRLSCPQLAATRSTHHFKCPLPARCGGPGAMADWSILHLPISLGKTSGPLKIFASRLAPPDFGSLTSRTGTRQWNGVRSLAGQRRSLDGLDRGYTLPRGFIFITTNTALVDKDLILQSMLVVDPNERIMQDSGWADGLRGIAAVYVASSHLVLCFGRQYTNPCCTDNGTPWLFQRPILRLIASGHSWVAIFFVLLGFVNALKPIKQARSGDSESALSGLSTAAFRRSFRLVLPASVATIISWTLCQTGAYELARNSDAYWLYTNTPPQSDSWCGAVHSLVLALMSTWRLGDGNLYDQPQWALIYLLMGSIVGYFVLLATVQLTSVWRSITLALCLFWSWSWSYNQRDPLVGFTVIGGILLAEFSVSPQPARLATLPLVSTFLSPVLALIGLVLMSYPSSNPDSAPWSAVLKYVFGSVFPKTASFSMPRLVGSVGALTLCLAILISTHLRRALSVKPLRWLGKLSFPIYLLHGTVMRTVLAWVVFAGQPLEAFPLEHPTDDHDTIYRYAQPGIARIAFGLIIMSVVTLYASHLWANNFEPAFGKITAWAEGKMKFAGDGPILTGSLSPHSAPRTPRSPIDRPEKREG
ncbi:hypothetical protein PMIN06_006138 [Paraphaeosphaeria minitans]